MRVKYFSQIWSQDVSGKEHILGQNQVALWNDKTHGRNPVKLQHRVLAVPVDDADPHKCITAGGDSVLIPTVAQLADPVIRDLYCIEQDKRLSPAFGWFFQGLHGTNLLAPTEQMYADKYTGFRKGCQLTVYDVGEIFTAGSKAYMAVDVFLPHIFVEPLHEDDAADTMYDIVTKREVRVVDTNLESTFRLRTVLGEYDGEYVADTILRHIIAKMWEITSHANASYEKCFKLAQYAKFYIGYKFDTTEQTDKEPIPAEDSLRKITRRVFLGDIGTIDTALQPLYSSQKERFAHTYHDVRYGATDIKTY